MTNQIRLSDVKRQYPEVARPQDVIGLFVNGAPASEQDFPRLVKEVNRCASVILVDGGANHFLTLLKMSEEKGDPLTVEPISLMGDLDSVSEETQSYLKQKFPMIEVFRFPNDKDFTDLEAAIQSVKLNEVAQVHLFYANGGRIDHELGNLMYMCRKENRGKLTLINANGEILQVAKCSGFQLFNKNPAWQLCVSTPGIIEDSDLSLYPRLVLVQELLKKPAPYAVQRKQETIFTVTNQSFTFSAKIAQTISLIPLNGAAYEVKTEGLNWNLDMEKFGKNICGISNIAVAEKIAISVRKGTVLCILNDCIDIDMYKKVIGNT